MKQQHYLEHSKINTYILPILAGVTVAITYAVAYPYWLRSIEYDSLYLGTTEFITGKLSEPQGLTLLVSAYLRQFYQWPILAALVIGILIILTGGSITIISKKQGNTYHWLSLIPPVILTTIGKGDPYLLVTGMFFWTTMALYVLISRIRIPLAFFILLVGYELLPWFIWAVWFLLAVFIEWTTRTGKKALIPIICLFIACFIMLKGVAFVVASTYEPICPATGQEVICAGNDAKRKQRPTKAGLNGLQPRPPKVIFPMPIATNAPIITIQTGRLEGRLKPNKSPVSMAEPSLMVGCFFSMYFVIAHSKNTQAATLDAQTTAEPMPK